MSAATFPLHVVRGVRVFGSGVARGEPWTEADIDAMVGNWKLYQQFHKPPLRLPDEMHKLSHEASAVLGHEEKQPLVAGMPATCQQNTGEPCFGVVDGLGKQWGYGTDGIHRPYLVANFRDVPAWLADALHAKNYRSVSAEIYDRPPEGMPQAKGPVLRRVSLLGAEVPQVKHLGPIPPPEVQQRVTQHAEARLGPCRIERVAQPNGPTIIRTFSEVHAVAKRTKRKMKDLKPTTKAGLKKFADDPAQMEAAPGTPAPPGVQRAEMLAMLADMGVDVSTISDAIPDPALAEWVRTLQMALTEEAPAEPGSEAAGAAGPAGGVQMSDGTKPMCDTNRMADGTAPAAITAPSAPAAPAPAPIATPGVASDVASALNRLPATVTMKFTENGVQKEESVDLKKLVAECFAETLAPYKAEIAKAQAEAQAAATTVKKFREEARQERIDEAVAKARRNGQVLPAELEPVDGKPAPLLARLARANAVQTFADGKTELDLQLEELAARPRLVKLGEKFGGGTDAQAEKGEQVAIVKRYAEENAADLAKVGTKPADVVSAFERMLADNPDTKASDFLGTAA